jgi:HupE / UreJ protein
VSGPRVAALVAAVLALEPAVASAHKPSDSLLSLRPGAGGGDGRWDIAVRDLDDVLGLDADGDGAVTWGELAAREGDVRRYALGRLALRTPAGPCAVEAAPMAIAVHSDGAYASLPLALGCPAGARALLVDYRLLFDLDRQHRGLVRVEAAGGGDEALILSAADHTREVALLAPVPGAASVPSFVAEGALHIWGGLDHVLFLLALLLPAVLRPALVDVSKIVTAFTAAHSLTLSLAALGLVQLSARITEPAIAASVILAAANNVRPLFGRDRWAVAFALGLLHGFGFSSVLADAGLARGRLVASLLGFNLGVELGQLAIVAVFVPLAFLLRRAPTCRRLALVGGSLGIAAVASVWFVARVLAIPTWS